MLSSLSSTTRTVFVISNVARAHHRPSGPRRATLPLCEGTVSGISFGKGNGTSGFRGFLFFLAGVLSSTAIVTAQCGGTISYVRLFSGGGGRTPIPAAWFKLSPLPAH